MLNPTLRIFRQLALRFNCSILAKDVNVCVYMNEKISIWSLTTIWKFLDTRSNELKRQFSHKCYDRYTVTHQFIQVQIFCLTETLHFQSTRGHQRSNFINCLCSRSMAQNIVDAVYRNWVENKNCYLLCVRDTYHNMETFHGLGWLSWKTKKISCWNSTANISLIRM